MNYEKTAYFLYLIMILVACNRQPKPESRNEITGTKAKDTMMVDTNYFYCDGMIVIPADQHATVSPPMAGFIRKLHVNKGDYVKKGAPLVRLQNHEYINIQKEYLELKQYVEYYREEFKRQGELTIENAASIKRMQQAKTEFWAKEANFKSLQSQLSLMGINPDYIEKNGVVHSINLYAPINGYIVSAIGNIGKYVDPFNAIYEISDLSKINVELTFNPAYLDAIKINDVVQYNILDKGYTISGKIISTGKQIKDDHVIIVSSIEKNADYLLPGIKLKARIRK